LSALRVGRALLPGKISVRGCSLLCCKINWLCNSLLKCYCQSNFSSSVSPLCESHFLTVKCKSDRVFAELCCWGLFLLKNTTVFSIRGLWVPLRTGGKTQWSELYECNGEHIARTDLYLKHKTARDMLHSTSCVMRGNWEAQFMAFSKPIVVRVRNRNCITAFHRSRYVSNIRQSLNTLKSASLALNKPSRNTPIFRILTN
jgi:hypothetical protein